MLRLAVLILLLANLGYYSWSNGLLAPWGLMPPSENEPERLHQQIAPQALQILAPGTGTSAPAPAAPAQASPPPATPDASPSQGSAPGDSGTGTASPMASHAASTEPARCLQAGPMNEERAAAVRSALAALPAGSWTMEASDIPGRWMVYMGRFADEETVVKKRTELRALKVPFDRPGPAFEPGLSLGRFATEEAAQRGLSDLTAHGIRTARVVQERAAQTSHLLRLPASTEALRSQIAALAVPWGDTPLLACR